MFLSGHIEPFWNNEYTKLEYTRNSFNNQSDVDRWIDAGYNNKHFTGKMHIIDPKIVDWASPFFKLFSGLYTGVTFYKIETGVIMPKHTDSFKFFIEKYKISNPLRIKRSLMFLEDWKSGHIFEIENNPITNWKAGDFVTWDINSPHLAANIGLDLRYTAQITYFDV